jgi:hypothetical protein
MTSVRLNLTIFESTAHAQETPRNGYGITIRKGQIRALADYTLSEVGNRHLHATSGHGGFNRHTGKQPQRPHKGQVVILRSNLRRWCSDGFEIASRWIAVAGKSSGVGPLPAALPPRQFIRNQLLTASCPI